MSRVLALGLLALVLAPACTCQPRRPVMETLKDEGEACMSDDICKTGLCDGLPSVCVRKCSTGCLAEEVCTQLTPGRFSCPPESSVSRWAPKPSAPVLARASATALRRALPPRKGRRGPGGSQPRPTNYRTLRGMASLSCRVWGR
jgi:hypothetical protein